MMRLELTFFFVFASVVTVANHMDCKEVNFPINLNQSDVAMLELRSDSSNWTLKFCVMDSDNVTVANIYLDCQSSEINIICDEETQQEKAPILYSDHLYVKIQINDSLVAIMYSRKLNESFQIMKQVCPKLTPVMNRTLMKCGNTSRNTPDIRFCSHSNADESSPDLPVTIWILVGVVIGSVLLTLTIIMIIWKKTISVEEPLDESGQELEEFSPVPIQQRPPMPSPRSVFMTRRQLHSSSDNSSCATTLLSSSPGSATLGSLLYDGYPQNLVPESMAFDSLTFPELSRSYIREHLPENSWNYLGHNDWYLSDPSLGMRSVIPTTQTQQYVSGPPLVAGLSPSSSPLLLPSPSALVPNCSLAMSSSPPSIPSHYATALPSPRQARFHQRMTNRPELMIRRRRSDDVVNDEDHSYERITHLFDEI